MLITRLKLKNFRNYADQIIDLNKDINIFYGDNAQGKTNIIEAIYVSAIGKSFRTKKDKELINMNEKNASIEVEFKKKDRDGKVKIELDEKKYVFLNGVKLKKLSELLGNLNVVTFIPDDINILKESPAERRKFLDMMIGQLRPSYIYNLNLYLKVLEQRNNYLRQIKYESKSENLLEIWDEKLTEYAEKIYEYRKIYIEKIKEKIPQIHGKITNNTEKIEIKYLSNFNEKSQFLTQLRECRKIDILKGYTTRGVHRDDFVIYLDGKEVKSFGSQGQNRTTVLSLKMTELQVINEEIGEYPILLLDDFMSELDQKRIQNFLKNVSNIQVIITCTDKFAITEKENYTKYSFLKVDKGMIKY